MPLDSYHPSYLPAGPFLMDLCIGNSSPDPSLVFSGHICLMWELPIHHSQPGGHRLTLSPTYSFGTNSGNGLAKGTMLQHCQLLFSCSFIKKANPSMQWCGFSTKQWEKPWDVSGCVGLKSLEKSLRAMLVKLLYEYLELVLKCRFGLMKPGWSLRFCLSNQLILAVLGPHFELWGCRAASLSLDCTLASVGALKKDWHPGYTLRDSDLTDLGCGLGDRILKASAGDSNVWAMSGGSGLDGCTSSFTEPHTVYSLGSRLSSEMLGIKQCKRNT